MSSACLHCSIFTDSPCQVHAVPTPYVSLQSRQSQTLRNQSNQCVVNPGLNFTQSTHVSALPKLFPPPMFDVAPAVLGITATLGGVKIGCGEYIFPAAMTTPVSQIPNQYEPNTIPPEPKRHLLICETALQSNNYIGTHA
jgi:hypothetical protein